MKILLLISILLVSISGLSQKRRYTTAAAETIFSFANIDDKGSSEGSTIRYAPVINIQTYYNSDVNSHVGFFIGLAFRNVGYIYDNYKTTTLPMGTYKKKFRSYNIGVPAGIKLGNLDRTFFYAGYEVELPVLYKEKTFDGGDKIEKITGWFSDRQELFQHGFFTGVEFPYGFNLKFKYYLSEFHNQDFTDGAGNKPYAGLKANIFYFSLSFFLFKDFKYDPGKPVKK
jgi:hypothetical protein